ncbi:AraC family ligand binding domain-containing protein [Desulfospira joergensenii]|uniref:AraC family ligand binding domain-containing protein n=1 Tax=Desulfospira joergensenii TaxID=53329 RepID=UPI0003B31908|nr:AraC family ligand binding domain-containing protein [Desulfospira joergensenii]
MKPKTDVKFFRDPALSGIDIGRVTNSRHCFPEHFHDNQYVVTLIKSGTCQCLGRKQKAAVAGPGSITLLNPGQIH